MSKHIGTVEIGKSSRRDSSPKAARVRGNETRMSQCSVHSAPGQWGHDRGMTTQGQLRPGRARAPGRGGDRCAHFEDLVHQATGRHAELLVFLVREKQEMPLGAVGRPSPDRCGGSPCVPEDGNEASFVLVCFPHAGGAREEERRQRLGDLLDWGRQTPFHRGPQQPRGCLQRAECSFNSLAVE